MNDLVTIDANIVERVHKDSGLEISKVEHLKDFICKGATVEEFHTFAMVCSHTGLDPVLKQIYFIKRWDGKLKREVGTPQTSIDGLRLIADRTGKYAPGPASKFTYNKEGQLISAESFVKKQTADGTWHLISSEAYFCEYCQTFTDNSGNQKLAGLWGSKPRIMLGKCAEALALRKAFPAEMAGVYTRDEMPQDYEKLEVVSVVDLDEESPIITEKKLISKQQLDKFTELLSDLPEDDSKDLESTICTHYKCSTLAGIPLAHFDALLSKTIARVEIFKAENGGSDE